MKDVLMEFISDVILQLRAEHFRLMNIYSHYVGAWNFVDKLSDLIAKYDIEEYLF